MIKPEMVEDIQDFYCVSNHKLPPLMVVFDAELSKNQRILCTKCVEDFDIITKMVTFKKAQQMIEESVIKRLEILENVIQPNIKQVELLQKNLHQLKSHVNQEFDQLIENTNDWIKNFDQVRQLNKKYSLFQELDKLIKNQLIQNINESFFEKEINKINSALSVKINSKLEQFSNFNEFKACNEILKNINNIEMNNCGANFQYNTIETKINDSNQIKSKTIDFIKKDQGFQQELELIQDYVYKDLQNLVNLLYSFKAVKEHFQDNLKHPMIIVCRNKIILQLNLSNAIYLDLQQQYKNDPFKQILLQEKKNAYNIITQIAQLLGDEYQSYIDNFKSNSLNENISYKYLILEKLVTQESNNSQITTNMCLQSENNEKMFSQWIKSKTFNQKNFDSCIFKAISYKQITELKLQSNFPNSN